MSGAEVVAFGPSLVDISARLDQAKYDTCHSILGIGAGEWCSIEDADQLSRLKELVVDDAKGAVAVLDVRETQRASFDHRVTMVAGSSTLGMLGSMPPEMRARSRMVTALASLGGAMDPLSSFYNQSLTAMGINHAYSLVEGYNPVGFVLSGPGHTFEKTLAMYPGVTQELQEYPNLAESNAALILMGAYELREGKLADYLDKVITSGQYRIGLSLGNRVILRDPLLQKLRSHIDNGRIHILCGNQEEYTALYPELDAEITSVGGFSEHPVAQTVPYALMTRGGMGLSAHWEGETVSVPAYPLSRPRIVNTSGAGDTAMGAFAAGVLERSRPLDTLLRAGYWATRTLQVPGSMILADY